MEIITGFTGAKHVRSEQDRDINIGTFGEESYVLQTGMKMAAEVSSNNEIKIRDGVIMHQGCAASIKKNTYDSVTIVNGSQGMKRIDLIVARYQRNQDDGKEFMRFMAIQGTPAESNPAVPSHITGDIQSGDAVADMPMYKIIIDGLNIVEVQKVFSEAPNITELNRNISGFKIRTGIVRISAEAKKSGAATIEYNGFSEPPLIFLSPLTNWADTANFTVSPDIRTTTEGKIVYYNGAAVTNTLYVGWAAIGH